MTENKSDAGELLRQGRLRQRLSIAECAKRTHIAVRYIEALEEERWVDLPSESHRLGFLKLYARFLGVPVEEILTLYGQKTTPPFAASAPGSHEAASVSREEKSQTGGSHWSPSSIPQVAGFGILALLLAWLIYHAVIPRMSEQNPMPWVHRRPMHQARLAVPKSSITVQKVRIQAQATSWLRVTTGHGELLFEGLLPAGTAKEWSGTGPFLFKIGNVGALTLFWNDQPVDITLGAHGSINDIRIPPQ